MSIYELESLLNKSDWSSINTYLINKNWEYYDSQSESSTGYQNVIWSYEKSYNSDKAQAWFYLTLID